MRPKLIRALVGRLAFELLFTGLVTRDSRTILRWVFKRGPNALTCEISVSGRQAHDVCLVPHWSVSSTVIERYSRPTEALRRHAELAASLRQAGWALVRNESEKQSAA
jgi:hypothetical protein